MQVHERKCTNNFDPVIIVDDSAIDLSITQRVYERSLLKNPLLTLASGGAFLDYMSDVRLGKSAFPSLVLMDINMPAMNGFETISRLREQSEFADLPVIVMLTNSDSTEDIERAYESGANGFHTKNFNFDRFIEFFNSLEAE